MGEPDSQFPKEWNCSESIPMVQVSPPTLAPSPKTGEGARVGAAKLGCTRKGSYGLYFILPVEKK
ncbi:MAG: hypothetical protein EBV05_07745 [Cyanobacteria bacterium WB6_1B_304]|jgi:hypothetical protein|nr:hypothetical protein [Cyanobacteria bacterium WB6_1B_304]